MDHHTWGLVILILGAALLAGLGVAALHLALASRERQLAALLRDGERAAQQARRSAAQRLRRDREAGLPSTTSDDFVPGRPLAQAQAQLERHGLRVVDGRLERLQ